MSTPIGEEFDPTQQRYNLIVKTKFFFTNVSENIKGRTHQYQRKMVLLIPQESTQRTLFLNAWLPEALNEHYEIPCFIAKPVDSPCRVAIFRGGDKRSENHYLLVMSKAVEDILVKQKEGFMVKIETFRASEDGEVDNAIDVSDGNYDLIDGHKDLSGE